VLRELAAKPRLFHTDYGLAHWEDVARRNVERELSVLAA
jgi:predicted metal-dependent HD superfamily phosphohydrolase